MTKKGEKITEEVKIKFRKTSLKTLVFRYNWKIIEPYLDIEINLSSTKRKKRYITFREFKDNIEQGISLIGMIRNGISDQIVQFYSNFCQGKIELEKEDFIKEYEKGKSLDEIALKYKVTRKDITYLRQLYKIKKRGGSFIKRKKTEKRLNQRQIEILYGTMMGDSSRGKSNSIAIFLHSVKQKEYLFWKFNEFKSICKKKNLKNYFIFDKRYNKTYEGWRFCTKANTDVENCIKEFYKSGVKEVSNKILEYLTPLSIAVWYMDDGSTCFYERKKKKGKHNIAYSFKFCTDSFSLESCNNIVKWFKKKYDIESYLREHKKNQNRVIIDKHSAQDFLNLVRPYIIPSMLYKIDYEEYKKWRKKKELLKEAEKKEKLLLTSEK